jgi:hypothetical protein
MLRGLGMQKHKSSQYPSIISNRDEQIEEFK